MVRPLPNSRSSNPKFFEKRKTSQAVSARSRRSLDIKIVLLHYLYYHSRLRVQTELASQVLFFLPRPKKEEEEMREDEARKEKSSKNDRGTQTTLSGRLMWIISCKKRQRQWIKKRSSKGEKAFRQGRNVSKENKTSMCCMSKGVKMTSVTWNCSRRESFHNLRLIHITWGNYWSTDFLRNNRLRWLRLWWTKRQVLLRKTLSLAEKLFLLGL